MVRLVTNLVKFLILFVTDAYNKIKNGEITLSTGVYNVNGNFIAVFINNINTASNTNQSICKGFYDKSYFTCNGSSITCTKDCNVRIYLSSGSIIGNNEGSGYFAINGSTKASIRYGYVNINTYSLKSGDVIQAFHKPETTGRNVIIGAFAIELT